jgi:hypothetical protein
MKSISIRDPYLQANHSLYTRTMWITRYSGKHVTQICQYYIPLKENVTPWHSHAGTEGRRRYNAKALTNSMLERGGWFTPQCSRLSPRKGPIPIVQEPEWALGPVWTGMENLTPSGFDIRTSQSAASRCTTYHLPHRQLESSTYCVFKYSSVLNPTQVFEEQFKEFNSTTRLLGASARYCPCALT